MGMMQILGVALLAIGLTISSPSVVEMTPHMTFVPRELTVTVGEVVVWKNAGEVDHTVNTNPEHCKRQESKEWVKVPAGATPIFSGDIKPGAEFRVRFEIPGTYQY